MMSLARRRTPKSNRIGSLALALILSLTGIASAPVSADELTNELEITKVVVGGPVVRVYVEVPDICWIWDPQLTRDSQNSKTLKVSILKVSIEDFDCKNEPYPQEFVFELPNDVTKVVDSFGKILYSRPGAEDFKLITAKAGSRAFKAYVIFNKKPAPIAYEYDLVCNNGKKANKTMPKPKSAAVFSNLKRGSICTITMTAVFRDSMKVKLESPPLKV
jgi:hypothetical protein